MKTLSRLAALAACLVCSIANASLEVTPLGPGLLATGNQTSQAEINTAILPFLGGQTIAYKNDVGQSDEGLLAGSYTTIFSNTPTDPANFTTTYNGGSILSDPSYLLVKDGAQIPAWYLFDISAWNAVSVLSGSGFWPAQGAISHISLYGGSEPSSDDPPVVPEPAAVLVWAGLAGLALGVVKMVKSRQG